MTVSTDYSIRTVLIRDRYDARHLTSAIREAGHIPDIDALFNGERFAHSRIRLCLIEDGRRVAASIALVQVGEAVTHVRHLWIDPVNEDPRLLYHMLAAFVHQHCVEHGCLKLVAQLPDDGAAEADLFDSHGFCRNRTYHEDGTIWQEFYVDLYWRGLTRASAVTEPPAYACRTADEYIG